MKGPMVRHAAGLLDFPGATPKICVIPNPINGVETCNAHPRTWKGAGAHCWPRCSCLAIGVRMGRAFGPPLAKTDPLKHLPESIVTAWKNAGAEVGWMRHTESFFHYVPENSGKPADLPAFQFKVWQEGRLAEAAGPGVRVRARPWRHTRATDAGLKELASSEEIAIAGPWQHQGDGCGADA